MVRVLRLVLSASAALSIWWVGLLAAGAHGDLGRSIAAASARLADELVRPLDRPARASLFLERGELYRLRGEHRLAEHDYDAAERYQPDLPAVRLARARLLLESGRHPEARRVLERLLVQTPAHPEALQLQARVLAALGRGARAVQTLDRALTGSARPEPDLYLARADLLAGMGPRHLPRALAGLDQGIRHLGPLVSLDDRAIDLEVALGRHDRAIARIDRQAAATIRKDVWLARRAQVLDRAGRLAEGRQTRQDALRALLALPPQLQARPATRRLQQELLAGWSETKTNDGREAR